MADVKKYASINDLDEAVDCILSAKSIIGPFKGLSEISTQTQNALDSLNDAWNYVENMKEGLGDYTASTKKSTSQPKSFSQQVAKQRAKNNSINKQGGLVGELNELYNYLNEAWDKMDDALGTAQSSSYPELYGLKDTLYSHREQIDGLLQNIKKMIDKWSE